MMECVWNAELDDVEVRRSFNLANDKKNVVPQDDRVRFGLAVMQLLWC